jgi:hypothetical protein
MKFYSGMFLRERIMISSARVAISFAVCCLFGHGLALAGEPAKQTPHREVAWEELLPESWHPEEIFDTLGLDNFSDNDPRADKALEAFNEAWKNAPANPALHGQRIKIPGFVAPLDWENSGQLKEFLLVPYFGACIHSPPPPANQIIYITMAAPLEGIKSMDVVWAYGTITVARNTSGDMGASSYSMTLDKAEPYNE